MFLGAQTFQIDICKKHFYKFFIMVINFDYLSFKKLILHVYLDLWKSEIFLYFAIFWFPQHFREKKIRLVTHLIRINQAKLNAKTQYMWFCFANIFPPCFMVTFTKCFYFVKLCTTLSAKNWKKKIKLWHMKCTYKCVFISVQ